MADQILDIQKIIKQAKQVITNPIDFFKNMPTSGGYVEPLIFVLVVSFVTSLILGLIGLIGLTKFNPFTNGAISLSMVFVLPLVAILGSFIGAAILFVIWKLMGSEKDYECAYRCVAYSFATGPALAAISFIPYIAGIIKTLWGCFLLYTASVEVHQIKAPTAKTVFGIFAAIGLLVGVNAERLTRNFMDRAERFSERTGSEYANPLEALEDIENMTPEEAGKEFGKFLKGMEEFQKGVEQEIKENK